MTKKLTPQELAKFRALLEHLRDEIAGDIDNLESDAFVTDGERPSADNPADIGSDSFAQEFSLELLARDEETLAEIQEALARIDAGEFGRCESCGCWIRRTRLNAVPYAKNCIACQRELEQAG